MDIFKDSSGNHVQVDQGESCLIQGTFYDLGGTAIAKASLVTLTASLINVEDKTVINSRNATSILDALGGSVSEAGVLQLTLGPLDNVIVSTNENVTTEKHLLLLTWTWTDGDGNTQTGKHEGQITVKRLPTPVT